MLVHVRHSLAHFDLENRSSALHIISCRSNNSGSLDHQNLQAEPASCWSHLSRAAPVLSWALLSKIGTKRGRLGETGRFYDFW